MRFVSRLVLAAVTLGLAGSGSLHASTAETGTVEGSLKGHYEGCVLSCRGVFLIPRSPEIDGRIAEKFGNLDEGSLARTDVPPLDVNRLGVKPPTGGRQTRCVGRFSSSFRFSGVMPGECYVTATGRAWDGDENELRTVEFMQRVTVRSAEAAQVRFAHTS